MSGLTWIGFEKELILKCDEKIDELWEFWEMKELCKTNLLWLFNLWFRRYAGIFLWCVRTQNPNFVDKLKIDDFNKIDELCLNEVLWLDNLQMILYSW